MDGENRAGAAIRCAIRSCRTAFYVWYIYRHDLSNIMVIEKYQPSKTWTAVTYSADRKEVLYQADSCRALTATLSISYGEILSRTR